MTAVNTSVRFAVRIDAQSGVQSDRIKTGFSSIVLLVTLEETMAINRTREVG